MINIYCLYIRSVAEQTSVVWSSQITFWKEYDFERMQKMVLMIIMKDNYESYSDVLFLINVQTLQARRLMLSKVFASKCTKNERSKDMFPLNVNTVNTRNPEKFQVTKAKTSILARSAIPSMQRQLNKK